MSVPYWLDEPYMPRAPLEGDQTADIAVLGGGVTGIAAARFLAERGSQRQSLGKVSRAGKCGHAAA